jgi:glycosyltransferase involved in cell wall biosynthesis
MPTSARSFGPTRVVHFVADLGKGGAEKQLYLLASLSSPAFEHRVLTVRGEGPWASELRAKGIPVHCLGVSTLASLGAVLGSLRYLRSHTPDLIHCWLPSMNLLGALVLWLGRMGQVGMIASIRNVDDWKPAWRLGLEKRVSRRWDGVICNSEAGLVCARQGGISKDVLHYVANGIPDPDKQWGRAEAREKFAIPDEAMVVACASRLVPQKRLSIVLEAARQLPGLQFVIAGDGPLRDELTRSAPSNVRLLGALTDTAGLFAAADVFLSVSEREGTSNSLLEALQAGCAALVTDVGDNLKLAGGAGRAITAGNLTARLQQLRDDPEALAGLRAAAPGRVRAYSVRAMVTSTESVYQTVAHRRTQPFKRVLYLDYTNGIGMGGGQRSLLLLLAHLDRVRFQPALACPADETWRTLVPDDVRVFDLPLPDGFRRLSRSSAGWMASLKGVVAAADSAWRLRRLIGREQIDVVHANNLKVALLAVAATFGRGVPVLWHVRDILPERGIARLARRIGSALATRVIAVSAAVARQFSTSTELVHNAVQLPHLESIATTRVDYRSEHGLPQDAFVFGYVGRIDPGKGIDVLLAAFARIAGQHRGAWLLIAGEGAARPALTDLGCCLGVERIVWTGFEASPGRAFAAMDCAIVPSVEPDSFPRAVIEAMSWALPVIGSSSGGIGEAIVDGQTGSVVPIGDVGQLALEMATLADDPGLARQRGDMGRRACQERFAVDGQMMRIETLYTEVLRGA